MIDLHSHTTASDGQHSAEELFALARKAGLTTLAVTDHDTVRGVPACVEAARKAGMRYVPGIEITTVIARREVHVLGHFIDPLETRLAGFSDRLRTERASRMEQMVEKLVAMGIPVSMEQVQGMAGDAHLARPHLARVLVELNVCRDVRDAFDRFLADGQPASVPRYEVSFAEASKLIRGAGGTVTVAHPGVSKVTLMELKEWKTHGLDGLEVHHSDHPPSLREKLSAWAKELDVVETAGSDFHGAQVAPNRFLGTQDMGQARFESLEARRPARVV
jgi:predicted metal-dependent phosphoesterase TrpH